MRCVSIEEAKEVAASNEIPILGLDDALNRLEQIDPASGRGSLSFAPLAGRTIQDAAHVLSVSPSTVKRDWRTAKAWLNREFGGAGP